MASLFGKPATNSWLGGNQQITLGDLISSDKNARNGALFGQFGMDPKGNNEIGAWARRTGQLAGYDFANQLAFQANNWTPWRQNLARQMMAWSQPGNFQAQTALMQQGAMNQGYQLGNQASRELLARGYNQSAADAVRLAMLGKAQRQANSYLGNEYERYMQQMTQLAPLLGSLSIADPSMMLNLGQFIEGRSAANEAARRQGGLAGLGNLIGMAAQYIPVGRPAQSSKQASGSTNAVSSVSPILLSAPPPDPSDPLYAYLYPGVSYPNGF